MMNWIVNKLEINHGHNTSLKSMEGLRGVAVFLVFWVHYSTLIKPWLADLSLEISEFIHSFGNLGVDLFFVLSGYLIYGTIISKAGFEPLKYAYRRVQRIHPTFLCVLMVYLLLSFLFPEESKLPELIEDRVIYILQNVLLLPGLFDIEPIITVAWSLSYEAFYYLFVPCVIFGLRLKKWSPQWRVAFWMIVAGIGFGLFPVVGIPLRLLMFVSGILLFELHRNLKVSISGGGTIALIVALLLFGTRSLFALNLTLSLLAIFILFLMLCLSAFDQKSFSYRWLIFSPLRWLGNMSYSYYLIHGLSLKFGFLLFAYAIPGERVIEGIYYWLWIPLFAFTLLASFTLFVLIERPMSLKVGPVVAISSVQAKPSATTE